jgi:5-methylcytosine-specific restriction endonuclease McrBC regulatory subunit McrC
MNTKTWNSIYKVEEASIYQMTEYDRFYTDKKCKNMYKLLNYVDDIIDPKYTYYKVQNIKTNKIKYFDIEHKIYIVKNR